MGSVTLLACAQWEPRQKPRSRPTAVGKALERRWKPLGVPRRRREVLARKLRRSLAVVSQFLGLVCSACSARLVLLASPQPYPPSDKAKPIRVEAVLNQAESERTTIRDPPTRAVRRTRRLALTQKSGTQHEQTVEEHEKTLHVTM